MDKLHDQLMAPCHLKLYSPFPLFMAPSHDSPLLTTTCSWPLACTVFDRLDQNSSCRSIENRNTEMRPFP